MRIFRHRGQQKDSGIFVLPYEKGQPRTAEDTKRTEDRTKTKNDASKDRTGHDPRECPSVLGPIIGELKLNPPPI
jgi:hypothetical protein